MKTKRERSERLPIWQFTKSEPFPGICQNDPKKIHAQDHADGHAPRTKLSL